MSAALLEADLNDHCLTGGIPLFHFNESCYPAVQTAAQAALLHYCRSHVDLRLQKCSSLQYFQSALVSIKCTEAERASTSYACVQVFQGRIKRSPFSLWAISWNSFSALASQHSAGSCPQKLQLYFLGGTKRSKQVSLPCLPLEAYALLVTDSDSPAFIFLEMILLTSPMRSLEKKRFCT